MGRSTSLLQRHRLFLPLPAANLQTFELMGFGSIYKPSVLLLYLFLSVQPTGFMCCG